MYLCLKLGQPIADKSDDALCFYSDPKDKAAVVDQYFPNGDKGDSVDDKIQSVEEIKTNGDKDSYTTHFTYSRKMNTGDKQDVVIKCGTSLNG
jgi:hypothetical protein